MILVFRFLELAIKLILLFLIISFERVIGLPVFFLTVSVSLMITARSFSKYLVFIFAAFMLAIFYQQAFILSFLILVFLYLGFIYGNQVIESNLHRFIALLLVSAVIIIYASGVKLDFWIITQLVASLFISSIFLLKFLFVRYGFLGKKMTAR